MSMEYALYAISSLDTKEVLLRLYAAVDIIPNIQFVDKRPDSQSQYTEGSGFITTGTSLNVQPGNPSYRYFNEEFRFIPNISVIFSIARDADLEIVKMTIIKMTLTLIAQGEIDSAALQFHQGKTDVLIYYQSRLFLNDAPEELDIWPPERLKLVTSPYQTFHLSFRNHWASILTDNAT